MICLPWQAALTGERRKGNLQTWRKDALLFGNANKVCRVPVCLLLAVPFQSITEMYVLKACMRVVLMVPGNLSLLYLISLFSFLRLLLFLFLLGFDHHHSRSSMALFVLFLPSLFYLANPYPCSSNVPSYLPHSPSLCSRSILSFTPLWHLMLALPIQLAKWPIPHPPPR